MKEESQIEDMRAALRGDRERAEARRRSTEDVRALLEPPEHEIPEPELPGPEQEAEPPERRSFFGRLFGR